MRLSAEGLDDPGGGNVSSVGNRRTQRRCHSEEIVMAGNSAAVPLNMIVAHMV